MFARNREQSDGEYMFRRGWAHVAGLVDLEGGEQGNVNERITRRSIVQVLI